MITLSSTFVISCSKQAKGDKLVKEKVAKLEQSIDKGLDKDLTFNALKDSKIDEAYFQKEDKGDVVNAVVKVKSELPEKEKQKLKEEYTKKLSEKYPNKSVNFIVVSEEKSEKQNNNGQDKVKQEETIDTLIIKKAEFSLMRGSLKITLKDSSAIKNIDKVIINGNEAKIKGSGSNYIALDASENDKLVTIKTKDGQSIEVSIIKVI